MREQKNATWNVEKGCYEFCLNNPKFSNYEAIEKLDTPYYTMKMQQEGIYEDYVKYVDELHEYAQSQQQTEGTMLMIEVVEPIVPESVSNFAKKYNLI